MIVVLFGATVYQLIQASFKFTGAELKSCDRSWSGRNQRRPSNIFSQPEIVKLQACLPSLSPTQRECRKRSTVTNIQTSPGPTHTHKQMINWRFVFVTEPEPEHVQTCWFCCKLGVAVFVETQMKTRDMVDRFLHGSRSEVRPWQTASSWITDLGWGPPVHNPVQQVKRTKKQKKKPGQFRVSILDLSVGPRTKGRKKMWNKKAAYGL